MAQSSINIRFQLETLLLATHRPKTDKLLEYLAHRGFFTASCAPHHDFKGGLAWHSMEVLLRMARYSHEIPMDSIVVVSILHSFKNLRKIRAIGFELKPVEKAAIEYALPPLGQVLENAIRYSRRNPMDEEDLQAALAGKTRPKVRIDNLNAGEAIDRRPPAKRTNKVPILEKNAIKPRRNISYDELVDILRGIDLDEDLVRDTLNNHYQPIYPYYSDEADNAQRQRLDKELGDLCPTGDTPAIVRFIFFEEKRYFNQHAKRTKIYEELVNKFGYYRGYDAFIKLAPSKPR